MILFIIVQVYIKDSIVEKNITTIANIDKVSKQIVDNSISINNEIINSKILDKYENFKKIVFNNSYTIPISNGIIPQGITVVDKYIFITGYYENGNKSKVIVMDSNGKLVNEVKLDTNSHVGSIAYDSINNLICIPGNNGRLLAYNKDDFLNNKEVHNIINIDYVKDRLYDYKYSNKYNIAFLTVDNDIYI